MTVLRVAGESKFSLRGGRGMQYAIEGSTDFLKWAQVSTVTVTNLSGLAAITDPTNGAAGPRYKFYRAVGK